MNVIPVPSRILIVALDNLGDLVFASALANPLHAAFPEAAIDVWSKAYTADVARLIPHVGAVIAADPVWAVPQHLDRPALGPFLRSIGAVRRGRYDAAIITGAPWRTAAAVAATRVPVRIGFARHRNQHFLTHVLPPEDARTPVVREQARLLEPLGVRSPDPKIALERSQLDERSRRVGHLLPARFVALHPFAGAVDRCVALDEWLRLARLLRERAMPVLWVGTPRELMAFRVLHRESSTATTCYADQLGDRSLGTTAAALSRAAMLVGHDSGPMHVAAAFGVPVVGIFAPGQPERTLPQGAGPWRMIRRPTPAGITAEMMLHEMDDLGLFSTA